MMKAVIPKYNVRKIQDFADLQGDWDSSRWKNVEKMLIGDFRKESSAHHPKTEAKVLYGDDALYCMFKVRDRFVKCVHTDFQSEVWKDSCVELFLQPSALKGYFNFEINCGGALRCAYNEYSTKRGTTKRAHQFLSAKLCENIGIFHSLARKIASEIKSSLQWIIEARIPFSVFESYIGKLEIRGGGTWRANFYKCGDETSHPHWAAWSPVHELNFHGPQDFGILHFEKNRQRPLSRRKGG
jgi:hypothetical protein